MFETKTSTLYGAGGEQYKIAYLYDGNSMIGLELAQNDQAQTFYFRRNAQGDVMALFDAQGVLKVRYHYDAWGNCTIGSSTADIELAKLNPIRYRGYYYDQDTGLYYLNARYYSPELRRFISPDDTAYLDPENANGLNLYAYCYNDPVNYADPSGHLAVSTFVWIIIGAAVLTTAGVVTYGAITDRPIVLDFSFSAGMGAGVGGKIGLSVVLDFKNNSLGFYPHYGYYYGAKFNVFGFSYGVGFISNYENEGDYAGPFISFGGGLYGGIDHCYDPRYLYNDTVRASSITFGNNKGGYYGYDYYDYWGSVSFSDVVSFLQRRLSAW